MVTIKLNNPIQALIHAEEISLKTDEKGLKKVNLHPYGMFPTKTLELFSGYSKFLNLKLANLNGKFKELPDRNESIENKMFYFEYHFFLQHDLNKL